MTLTRVAIALLAALIGVLTGLAFWVLRRRRPRIASRISLPPLSEPMPTPSQIDAAEAGATATDAAATDAAATDAAATDAAAADAPAADAAATDAAAADAPAADAAATDAAAADAAADPAADLPVSVAPTTARSPSEKPAAVAPGSQPPAAPAALAAMPPLPSPPSGWGKSPGGMLEDDDDMDLTIVTIAPFKASPVKAPPPKKPPKVVDEDKLYDDDDDLDDYEPQRASAVPIIFDDDAAVDEPTAVNALILVSAAGQTDRGQRRRKNEDSFAIMDAQGVFVVADGMGGHSGGEVASKIAVDVITDSFKSNQFDEELFPGVPRRGSELAVAIQRANQAIFEQSRMDPHLSGMGTTVVSARFSPNKQRAYIGHVGDSRCYRLRAKELKQITTDHTMGGLGLRGPLADRLERAVGIAPTVKVDIIVARPLPDDLYLLCSDGLSKMISADEIRDILLSERRLDKASARLIARANESGGKDNITVILIKVASPVEVRRMLNG